VITVIIHHIHWSLATGQRAASITRYSINSTLDNHDEKVIFDSDPDLIAPESFRL
jgi:hypothetical protein